MPAPKDIQILCAEDNPAIRKGIQISLVNLGFKPAHYALSGNQAQRLLLSYVGTQQKVDFIITDIMMDNGSGLELLDFIRNDNNFKNLPILVLSSENDRKIVMNAIKLGATNYLLKPWTDESLLEKIDSCWEKIYEISAPE